MTVSAKPIRFTFGFQPWELLLYSTESDRHDGERVTRVAAYHIDDPAPRGPRRAWTLKDDRSGLVPWGPRYEGDWPELDRAAHVALEREGIIRDSVTGGRSSHQVTKEQP